MSAKEESFSLGLPGEYIIKHVEGAPEHTPNRLSHSGRIDAPQAFIAPKKDNYDPKRATVVIDTDAGLLVLILGEKDRDEDEISGKLEMDSALAELGINSEKKKYIPRDLHLVFKRMGQFFTDKQDHLKLLARLNNFSARVSKAYVDDQSNTGNAKKSIETVVEGFDPIFFELNMPLFKGDARQKFTVEVGVDASGGSVLLFLDSPELYELDYNRRRELLDAEAEFFKGWGSAVIYKS